MKRTHLFSILTLTAFLAILAGCEKAQEQIEPNESGNTVTLTASLEQPVDVQGTKTSLGSSNATLWSTGDQIKVFSGTSDATGSVMTLSSAAGTSNGEFALATGSPAVTTSAPYYGFYPYTTTVSPSIQAIDGTAVFYATMGNQTYVANSFGNNAVPMIAKASANSTLLAFKHVYGLLKLQLKGTGTGPEVRVYQIRVHPLPVKN